MGYYSANRQMGYYSPNRQMGYSAHRQTGYYPASRQAGYYSDHRQTGYYSAIRQMGYYPAHRLTGNYPAFSYYSAPYRQGSSHKKLLTPCDEACMKTFNFPFVSNHLNIPILSSIPDLDFVINTQQLKL